MCTMFGAHENIFRNGDEMGRIRPLNRCVRGPSFEFCGVSREIMGFFGGVPGRCGPFGRNFAY